MSESSELLAALKYAADQGFPVLPVRFVKNDDGTWRKQPRFKEWQKKASTDPATIRAWWKQFPGSAVGILTGPRSDLFVIDVDGEEGRTTLARLQEEHGELPETLRAITASGGEHWYFWWPDGLPNSVRKLGPGIDTRGEGGQVVAPPSVRPDGAAYAWVEEGAEPAELPDAWISALMAQSAGQGGGSAAVAGPTVRHIQHEPEAYARGRLNGVCEEVREAPEGERNPTLNTAALRVGHYVPAYLSEDEARDALVAAGLATGLDHTEARTAVASGLSKGMSEPETLVQQEISGPSNEDKLFLNELAKAERRDRVNQEMARRRADAAFVPPDEPLSLAGLLAQSDEPLRYTVDQLQPEGTNLVLVAPKKVGKTVWVCNYAKSWADGGQFLGWLSVDPPDGPLWILDYELTPAMFRSYIEPLDIKDQSRLQVVHLRGTGFDLRSRSAREWLLTHMQKIGCGGIVLDPFGTAAKLTNDNDNSEARNWLVSVLEPFKEESGARDLVLPVHASDRGQQAEGGEHVRGASSVDDWADVLAYYTKQALPRSGDNNEGVWMPRYLRAEGRGVELPEHEIHFDKDTHELYMADGRSRSRARAEAGVAQIIALVEATPGINSTDLRDAYTGDKNKLSEYIAEAVRLGRVVKKQEGRSVKHYPRSYLERQETQ